MDPLATPLPRSAALGLLDAGVSVLFLALLAVVSARAVIATPGWGVPASAAGLAAWFLVGLALHRRIGRRGRAAWVVGLLAGTLAMLLVSREVVWLLFPVWLLAGQVLSLPVALSLTGLSLVGVITEAALAGEVSSAAILGPVLGALVALGASRGVLRLEAEARAHRVLLQQVLAAQREASVLAEELARSQREAGVLAERTRLAHDIHDTLAQGFSSILLLARAAQREQDAHHRADLVAQIEASASANLAESRRVVYALVPSHLEGSGLVAGLRSLTEDLVGTTGASVTLSAEAGFPRLPTALEVALLRTAQGLLANVERHAAAHSVAVTLTHREAEVRLDVVDDGRGFDPRTLPATPTLAGGYGLRALRERLAALGGGLDVESEPRGGTAASAHLPLSEHRTDS